MPQPAALDSRRVRPTFPGSARPDPPAAHDRPPAPAPVRDTPPPDDADGATAVARLRALGEPAPPNAQPPDDAWPDYPAAYGLTRDDVPALVALALDETALPGSDPAVWAPLHAWRALGQLGAPEAAEPLAGLLARLAGVDSDDDWGPAELPRVLGMLGPAALAPAHALLDDATRDPLVRAAGADALGALAMRLPETRAACVAALTSVLARADTEPDVAAFVVSALVHAGAVEAAPAIEAAFAADRVEVSYNGDWEDVQLALGLLAERRTPRPRYVHPRLAPMRELDDALAFAGPPPGDPAAGTAARHARERAKAKAKRKAAARSRRANRRKR